MSTNSDHPCTSSNESQPAGKSYDETFVSIRKLPRPTSLMKSSPSLERKDSNPIAKGSESERTEPPPLSNNLARAPSTPACLAAAETQDEEEEIEFSMGKLIRQASLKSSHPRNHVAKGATAVMNSGTSARKVEFGNRKLERLRPRRVMNQLKTQKSLSDLESFELQGFKDLGFDVGSKHGAISMIPESHEEDQTRGGKRSKEDDIKAQIKFWARAVASNVNQE
ncbi:uncharacterized protein LOC131012842 [Salvia miltiorrhiza]|uniref:uncharacterized protein LOC131012842 n=1 Tax=Salvia miltiorrhiza TaxID=226208 RepID=UPI0025AD70BF|nr:uncharacterized protein LOC131012842 [Salvia miltiorrhiza]